MEENPTTEGRYLKKCKGCGKEFRSDARNTKWGPPELCKCASRQVKLRAKRARERREYHKDPDHFRALTRTRSQARRAVIKYFDDNGLALCCNSPGCRHNFDAYLEKELAARELDGRGPRGAKKMARQNLLKALQAHHRDHDPWNNYLESYPERSNIELLCRHHHEQSDRAKAGKAQIELWKPQPTISWLDWLIELRTNSPRRFFTIPVPELRAVWEAIHE